jgi:hypothetical protein
VETNGLSSKLIFEELLREGGRRKVSKARLFPLPVIKDFDIFGDCLPCLFMRSKAAVMDKFIFERAQKLSIGALS